jgi:uncharacterized membrane-anchored protein YitT (DUF2179 family)
VLSINVLLFFLASKKLHKESLVKTFAGVVLLSFFLEATSHTGFYCSDIFIGSIFGGVLSGIGIGFTMRRNASTGGSDFGALILQRKLPHISPAKIILIIDFIIVSVSGIVFKDYIICFYSLVSLYVCSYIADRILTMGDYAKSVIVVSEKSDEIARIILNDINRGVTAIYSKGCYKNKSGTMLMSVVKTKELPGLLEKIKETDPKSFVTITDIKEVLSTEQGLAYSFVESDKSLDKDELVEKLFENVVKTNEELTNKKAVVFVTLGENYCKIEDVLVMLTSMLENIQGKISSKCGLIFALDLNNNLNDKIKIGLIHN